MVFMTSKHLWILIFTLMGLSLLACAAAKEERIPLLKVVPYVEQMAEVVKGLYYTLLEL
jgi:hypothetical protein